MAYSEYTPAFLFFITNGLPNHHLPAITDFHFFLFLIRFLLQKYSIFFYTCKKNTDLLQFCYRMEQKWNKEKTSTETKVRCSYRRPQLWQLHHSEQPVASP